MRTTWLAVCALTMATLLTLALVFASILFGLVALVAIFTTAIGPHPDLGSILPLLASALLFLALAALLSALADRLAGAPRQPHGLHPLAGTAMSSAMLKKQ